MKYTGNDAASQRLRLMQWFDGRNSLTTQEARELLDIMSPAARVFELRAAGWRLTTVWDRLPTVSGRLHRMARYVCMGRP